MKAYSKAVLEVEEFVLNADIADPSVPVDQQIGGGGLDSVGVEFEILTNSNDEI